LMRSARQLGGQSSLTLRHDDVTESYFESSENIVSSYYSHLIAL
jgi:hypothetical protein